MIERIGSSVNQSLRQLKDDAAKLQVAKQRVPATKETATKGPKDLYTIETHKKVSIEDNEEKFKTTDVDTVKTQSADDLKIASEIGRLKMWEAHVKQHERQHQLVGGEFAGAPSYTYSTGPDGKRYISGGEVSMYIPAGGALEDSVAALERVKRAASAPADPSPQDLKTAAMASAKQASVRMALARKQAKDAYETTRSQELQIKEIKGEPIEPINRFKFNEVAAFELFI